MRIIKLPWQIDKLMDAAGFVAEEELYHWVSLVEDYEQKHFPITPPNPDEAARFRLEQAI
jgi:HTH-type transcriptional regulator/antitoxin HigA